MSPTIYYLYWTFDGLIFVFVAFHDSVNKQNMSRLILFGLSYYLFIFLIKPIKPRNSQFGRNHHFDENMNICEKTCTSTKLHHHAFFFHSISNHYILNVTSLQFHTLLGLLEFRSPLHMFASITSLLTKCTNIIGLMNTQIAPDMLTSVIGIVMTSFSRNV